MTAALESKMQADRFTAVLEISAVRDEHETTTGNGYNSARVTVPRKVEEVVRLVIRADTLDALKEKVAAHIALV